MYFAHIYTNKCKSVQHIERNINNEKFLSPCGSLDVLNAHASFPFISIAIMKDELVLKNYAEEIRFLGG